MSKDYDAMEVEKWVNLEDIADHLSVSTDTAVRPFPGGFCGVSV